MIGTLLQVEWRTLRRSRMDLLVMFIVPIVFFAIFGAIFGAQRSATPTVKLALVDEADSPLSRALVRGLRSEAALKITDGSPSKDKPRLLTRDEAKALVQDGKAAAALAIPKGIEEGFFRFGGGSTGPAITIYSDPSDPIAPQMLLGLLQKAAMSEAAPLLAERGSEWIGQAIGGFAPEQAARIQEFLSAIPTATEPAPEAAATDAGFQGPIAVEVIQVLGQDKANPTISYYAAAIAVMFLLFSAAGAGGSLLAEAESGSLERLLMSSLGLSRLLFGKWLFLTLTGVAQVVLMFLFGQLVFGLDFSAHLGGFFAMTIPTAGAASAFGLVLATLCKSRSQLSGISTIAILSMSALGGSMFPRFLMSETMQSIGSFTFNAWAVDGFTKVFWRGAPLVDLLPEITVLTILGLSFFLLARLLARRFETT